MKDIQNIKSRRLVITTNLKESELDYTLSFPKLWTKEKESEHWSYLDVYTYELPKLISMYRDLYEKSKEVSNEIKAKAMEMTSAQTHPQKVLTFKKELFSVIRRHPVSTFKYGSLIVLLFSILFFVLNFIFGQVLVTPYILFPTTFFSLVILCMSFLAPTE